ncbi:major facilitator superfamily transporter [Paraphaeosphaeria minitans]|uniref:Major facilitator superfamily transporter n=1 Tax=Paraphaeosphaeria minitans TaxID=565426 RepID=A0A9P6GLT9_9PLEO|nr:major facilitator superfamily transporter [Paraphaeosphaeria minitans]
MGNDRPYPKIIEDRESYVVIFDGPNDPWHPMNWSFSKKCWIATMVCYCTLVATFNSALFSPAAAQASQDLFVGKEFGALATSLYILGFAFGPLIWGPGCELMGRRTPLIVGSLGSAVFTLGSAVAKDIQTLIICRFFAGVFGSSPLCVVPGILADVFDDYQRGPSIAIYALAVFAGPLAASFIGGYIVDSYLRWRWTLYLPALMGFSAMFLLLLFLEETHADTVLLAKAARIRQETGNWSIHAEHSRVEVDAQALLRKYLVRPLRMLVTEPIVLLVSIYMSFIYGLTYCLVGAYPYVFQNTYRMNKGTAALPLVAVILGLCLAVCFIIWQQLQSQKTLLSGNGASEPEARLLPVIVGAFVFPIGIFWFSWTAFRPSMHWMVPTASGVLTGFGLLCIFMPCFNYLVEAYLPLAASTVAANVMLRSGIAAGFPLFSVQMFANLGIQWAGTLLGCLAIAMIPIALGFRAYGAHFRRSKLLSGSKVIV